MHWCVIPAAGSGRRAGGERPKQYQDLLGRPLLLWTLEALAAHPSVAGLMVVLAPGDPFWPGLAHCLGKPVHTTAGGAERAHSVLNGLRALPASVAPRDWVLVHDAARPCLRLDELSRLVELGTRHPVGALLAQPMGDTVKRADANAQVEATVARENLWRAQTPQLFRRGELTEAMDVMLSIGSLPTDEANSLEMLGKNALLVEGSTENLKVTSALDLAVAAAILAGRGQYGS
jgi:2-C-methyl-D-erythritol 4-phosphate cytidylyltransferase